MWSHAGDASLLSLVQQHRQADHRSDAPLRQPNTQVPRPIDDLAVASAHGAHREVPVMAYQTADCVSRSHRSAVRRRRPAQRCAEPAGIASTGRIRSPARCTRDRSHRLANDIARIPPAAAVSAVRTSSVAAVNSSPRRPHDHRPERVHRRCQAHRRRCASRTRRAGFCSSLPHRVDEATASVRITGRPSRLTSSRRGDDVQFARVRPNPLARRECDPPVAFVVPEPGSTTASS
jgi:hypothetical protein